MTFHDWLVQARQEFPLLHAANCRPTSPADGGYNCIAWAAEDSEYWWWPDPMGQYFWPAEAPRSVTLDAFVHAYSLRGYRNRSDPQLEPGVLKVALYANPHGVPTHAARQLPDGWWASKLGSDIDIEHELGAVEGPAYGKVAVVLARPAA